MILFYNSRKPIQLRCYIEPKCMIQSRQEMARCPYSIGLFMKFVPCQMSSSYVKIELQRSIDSLETSQILRLWSFSFLFWITLTWYSAIYSRNIFRCIQIYYSSLTIHNRILDPFWNCAGSNFISFLTSIKKKKEEKFWTIVFFFFFFMFI